MLGGMLLSMKNLSNQALIKTYAKAKELNLANVFVQLIIDEMKTRDFTEDENISLKKINQYQDTKKEYYS